MSTERLQKKDATSASSAALAIVLDTVPRRGNTLIFWGAAVNSSVGPSGGGVSNWLVIKSFGVTQAADLWYGIVDTTPSATVTYTLSIATRCLAKVEEWSGRLKLDTAINASATNTTIDPGTITTNQGETLYVTIGAVFNTISAGPTDGFTDEGTVTSATFSMGAGSKFQDVRGTAHPTWTCTSSGWDAAIGSMLVVAPAPYEPLITPRSGPLVLRRMRRRVKLYAAESVAGPQNLSATTSDTVTTSESVGRVLVGLRSTSEAVTTSDVATRTEILLRTSSDAVTTADVVTRVLGAFRTTTDAVSATQAATRTGTFLRSATDTLTTAEAVTRIGTFLRTTTDAVTLSDVATDVKTKNATTTDALTTSDVATRLGTFLRSGTDAVTTSDSALRTELDSRQGTDTVTTSESVTRLLVALRTSTDAVTTSETLTRLLAALRSTTDAVTASQVATRILAALRSTSDAVTTSDAATRLVAEIRSATDAVTTSETTTRLATLLRTTSDAVSTSESATATLNNRTATDAVTTSDVATTAKVLFRSASDGLAISDAATASGGASSTGTGHPGRPKNPNYGKQIRTEMTRKPTIEDIRRETVLVATNDTLVVRDTITATVEYTDDERVLEALLLGVS